MRRESIDVFPPDKDKGFEIVCSDQMFAGLFMDMVVLCFVCTSKVCLMKTCIGGFYRVPGKSW